MTVRREIAQSPSETGARSEPVRCQACRSGVSACLRAATHRQAVAVEVFVKNAD